MNSAFIEGSRLARCLHPRLAQSGAEERIVVGGLGGIKLLRRARISSQTRMMERLFYDVIEGGGGRSTLT